jgi:hypothetical protein
MTSVSIMTQMSKFQAEKILPNGVQRVMAALLMSVCYASQVVRTCQRIFCLHSLTVHIFKSHGSSLEMLACAVFCIQRKSSQPQTFYLKLNRNWFWPLGALE